MIDTAELKALIQEHIKIAESAAIEAEKSRIRAVGGQMALRNLLKQIEQSEGEPNGNSQSDDIHA